MSGGSDHSTALGHRDTNPLLSDFGINGKKGITKIELPENDCEKEDVHRRENETDFSEKVGLAQNRRDNGVDFLELRARALTVHPPRCTLGQALSVCTQILLILVVGFLFVQHVHLKERVAQLEERCLQNKLDSGVAAAPVSDADTKVVAGDAGGDVEAGDSPPLTHWKMPWMSVDSALYRTEHDDKTQDEDEGEVDDETDEEMDDEDEEKEEDEADNESTPQRRARRSAEESEPKGKKKNKSTPSDTGNEAGKAEENGKKKGKGGKFCRRVENCIKDPQSNKKCRKILKCIPPTERTIKPVHFMSKFWSDEGGKRSRKDFGESKDITGSNEVPLKYAETPLTMLEPADWMAGLYPGGAGQPLVPVENGGYTVQEDGLYLIYSSVLFHDVKHRQSQAVVVNGHKLFKCMDSVDYIDHDLPVNASQAKYKSCSMTGVTQLKKGDRLEVQNLYANTEIDLSTDATYFGAVFLGPSP